MRDDITAVMIVKNEAQFLDRCLESIVDIMPIVIADTGSTDDTMEIARVYTTEIYTHPWQDSFSEARNWITAKVDTKWALQIDADEELVESTVGALDDLDDDIAAYQTAIHNPRANGTSSLHYFERLIQPKKVRYEWRVHNAAIVDGDIGKSQLTILHYGCNQSDEVLDRKFRNTLRLLRMDIEDAGYIKRNVLYLVQTLRSLKEFDGVIEVVEEHGHVVESDSTASQSLSVALMLALAGTGDTEKAIQTGIEVVSKHPQNIDALYSLGIICEAQGRIEEAIEYLLKYIQARRRLQYGGTIETIIYTSWGSLIDAFAHLGACLIDVGRTDDAILAFARADRLAIGRVDEENFTANTDQAVVRQIEGHQQLSGVLIEGGWR